MNYNMVLLPAVARFSQFRVVFAKAFPAENAIHPQTLKLIINKGSYLPACIHPVGICIKRAQNFIHLKKYCKVVKLRGERRSESLLDNLNKAACVCRKYAVASYWQVTNTVVPLAFLQMSLCLSQPIISPTHNSFSGVNFTSMETPWHMRLARSVEMTMICAQLT